MARKNRLFAKFANASRVDETGVVDTGTSIASDYDSGGTTSVATFADIPLVNNTTGDQVFVEDTKQLFIWNGAGWYEINLINESPVISTSLDATYELATDGTPTVITLQAIDANPGTTLTWSYSGNPGATATVAQADNVFTITPSTDEANEGSFDLTFTASDGINTASVTSTFSLVLAVPAGQYTQGLGSGGGITELLYDWVVPDGVTSISAVAVGGGGRPLKYSTTYSGGGGGALAYANNIPVTPGETLTIKREALSLNSQGKGHQGNCGILRGSTKLVWAEGGEVGNRYASAPGGSASNCVGDVAYSGGSGEKITSSSYTAAVAAGGAAGYTTNGGNNGSKKVGAGSGGSRMDGSSHKNGGGGIGLYGTTQGSAGGTNYGDGAYGGGNGSGSGYGGSYGGGAGIQSYNYGYQYISTGTPGGAAVRIIWGDGRSYPDNALDV